MYLYLRMNYENTLCLDVRGSPFLKKYFVPLGCNVRYSGISNREADLLEHGKIKFLISTVM